MSRIEEIREKARKCFVCDGKGEFPQPIDEDGHEEMCECPECYGTGEQDTPPDIAFLLAEVERLQTENEFLRSKLPF